MEFESLKKLFLKVRKYFTSIKCNGVYFDIHSNGNVPTINNKAIAYFEIRGKNTFIVQFKGEYILKEFSIDEITTDELYNLLYLSYYETYNFIDDTEVNFPEFTKKFVM